MFRRPLLVFAALALVLSGCSGKVIAGVPVLQTGSGQPPAPSSAPSPAGTAGSHTSTAPLTNSVAATATLKQIVLHAGDLPHSYKASSAGPRAERTDDLGSDRYLARCTGVPLPSDTREIAGESAPDFSDAHNPSKQVTISSDAQLYSTQRAVDAQVAQLTSPRAATCLRRQFHNLRGGVSNTHIHIHVISGPHGGPDNVAGTLVLSMRVNAGSEHLGTDNETVLITGPRITASVTAECIGTPVPHDVLARAVATVAQRARNA